MTTTKDCLHELREGEIWLGNSNPIISKIYRNLKTIRLGKKAYDINGKPLNKNYMLPLIIHKSEKPVYDKIYMERMKEAANKYL